MQYTSYINEILFTVVFFFLSHKPVWEFMLLLQVSEKKRMKTAESMHTQNTFNNRIAKNIPNIHFNLKFFKTIFYTIILNIKYYFQTIKVTCLSITATAIEVCIISAICIVTSLNSFTGWILNARICRFPFIDLIAPVTRAYAFSWIIFIFLLSSCN